jgi:hypothetical protein
MENATIKETTFVAATRLGRALEKNTFYTKVADQICGVNVRYWGQSGHDATGRYVR